MNLNQIAISSQRIDLQRQLQHAELGACVAEILHDRRADRRAAARRRCVAALARVGQAIVGRTVTANTSSPALGVARPS